MPLPWTHLSPASITDHFDESIIIGTLVMSGSVATELEETLHRRFGVEQALVHVDVDDLGAVLHLLAGDVERGLEVALGDQPAELGRAGDVGALADVDEDAGAGHDASSNASRPDSRSRLGTSGTALGFSPATASAMARM